MDMSSVIFACFLLLGFLVEETPCEQGENMQTPHRKAQEMAHLSTEGLGRTCPPYTHTHTHTHTHTPQRAGENAPHTPAYTPTHAHTPLRPGENLPPMRESNPGPSYCEAAVQAPEPPCHSQ